MEPICQEERRYEPDNSRLLARPSAYPDAYEFWKVMKLPFHSNDQAMSPVVSAYDRQFQI